MVGKIVVSGGIELFWANNENVIHTKMEREREREKPMEYLNIVIAVKITRSLQDQYIHQFEKVYMN